jgi:uncharacterized protein (DUF2249 family)
MNRAPIPVPVEADESDMLEIDVRPLIAARQPPINEILDGIGRLAPGQSLRLVAPFEPVPLYGLLGQQGFEHEASRADDGSWVIVFRR